MRVLCIALSCSPFGGSEDAVGWNTPLAMARGGMEVTVIARAEQKHDMDIWRVENPNETMPRFIYVPVPKILDAKPFRGQFQSLRLNPWLRRVHRVIKAMIAQGECFDVIHQITPVEFRAVMRPVVHSGINVIGPLGGAGEPCEELRPYLESGMAEAIRLFFNRCTRSSHRRSARLASYDLRYFANRETHGYLLDHGAAINDCLMTDVGCLDADLQNAPQCMEHEGLHLLFIGRLVPRKGARLLLEALSLMKPDAAYELRIYGDGTERKFLEQFVEDNHLNKISFIGHVEHSETEKAYQWADVLVFPSIRDTTGVVLLESLAHGLPVIAFRQMGASLVLDDSCAQLVNPHEGMRGFARAISRWVDHPEMVPSTCIVRQRAACFTWEHKVDIFMHDYSVALSAREGAMQ